MKGVKVASHGVFGTVWSGTTAKSTKIRCFFMKIGWNWSFWCKNRSEFMVLKVFWNGDFGRWNVELPKRWADDDNGHCVDFCWGIKIGADGGERTAIWPIYKGRRLCEPRIWPRVWWNDWGRKTASFRLFFFIPPPLPKFSSTPQKLHFLTVYRKNLHHAHFPKKYAYHVNPPYLIYAKKRTHIVYQKMQCKVWCIIWVS